VNAVLQDEKKIRCQLFYSFFSYAEIEPKMQSHKEIRASIKNHFSMSKSNAFRSGKNSTRNSLIHSSVFQKSDALKRDLRALLRSLTQADEPSSFQRLREQMMNEVHFRQHRVELDSLCVELQQDLEHETANINSIKNVIQ
jgi:hypothetical protein